MHDEMLVEEATDEKDDGDDDVIVFELWESSLKKSAAH